MEHCDAGDTPLNLRTASAFPAKIDALTKPDSSCSRARPKGRRIVATGEA